MTDSETTEEQVVESIDERSSFSILPIVVIISLLLALAAAGGAVTIWFNSEQQQIKQSQLLSNFKKQITLLQQVQQDNRINSDSVNATLKQQQQIISTQLEQITEKLGRKRYDWAVAEIRYTLIQANMRLQLFKDKGTALVALQLADTQLARLAVPALHKVRGTLNKEIAALRAVKEIDIEGVSLKLSALAGQVKELSIVDPGRNKQADTNKAPIAGSEKEIAEWQKHADAIWSEMKTLVTIRRTDKKIIPLLGEQEIQQLRQALGLKIEIARLALLQRNTALFQSSLEEASNWLDEYFNAQQPSVVAIKTELKTLKKLQLEPVYPDISQSLAMLEASQNGAVSVAPSKKKKTIKNKEKQSK
ncbi:MAG: uroporphyrinogen-III C-methyltransferase [Sulfuriflexus sp.]|nr:uroporphyrinogen-III C-methyltransferase [Sulfuriflexus sp.]